MPDMALSMRQILERFSRGQSIPQNTTANYSDEDFSEFDKMDKFEKLDLAAQIREDIVSMQHEMQNPSTPPPTSPTPTDGDKDGDKNGDKAGDKAQKP